MLWFRAPKTYFKPGSLRIAMQELRPWQNARRLL